MDEKLKQQFNISVLRRYDPQIESIVDTTSHVALYEYDYDVQNWVKKGIEGALFIYKKKMGVKHVDPKIEFLNNLMNKNASYFGFIVLNRLSLENYFETLAPEIDFQIQGGIIMYKRTDSKVFGLWVYEKNDIRRICRQLSLCSIRTSSSASNNLINANDVNKLENKQAREIPQILETRVSSLNDVRNESLEQRIKNMLLVSNGKSGASGSEKGNHGSKEKSLTTRVSGLEGKKFSSKSFFEAFANKEASKENGVDKETEQSKKSIEKQNPSSLITKLSSMGVQIQNTMTENNDLNNEKILSAGNDPAILRLESTNKNIVEKKTNGIVNGNSVKDFEMENTASKHKESVIENKQEVISPGSVGNEHIVQKENIKPDVDVEDEGSIIARESANELISLLNKKLDTSKSQNPRIMKQAPIPQHNFPINNYGQGLGPPTKINYLGYPTVYPNVHPHAFTNSMANMGYGGMIPQFQNFPIGGNYGNQQASTSNKANERPKTVAPLNNTFANYNPDFNGVYYQPRSFYPQFNQGGHQG
ncbi:hypothetical protein BB559_003521 [Furculomyces boomerangus]|uniref:mRNA-decapping enzyme C-terminal domain-containing protein n=1 Tax=Furculomyces boomerangus TaxID=61424 RepID=A0A2T9YKT4_9FUNG|nr:hypothetical protein BB559_003521 [Furculomyces boomerangus]